MDKIKINNNIFVKQQIGNAIIIFTTAENSLNFSKDKSEFKNNISMVKESFQLDNFAYLNQIHSSIVCNYNGEVLDGDGLVTNKKHTALGIFTADCVPVLLYDSCNEVISAIHSGWRGTMMNITEKAINIMVNEYHSNPLDIYLIIGPHIRSCCYNVGEDLVQEFKNKNRYDKEKFKDGKLNMVEYIIEDGKNRGIQSSKIVDINLCTVCSDSYKFHSYRRDKEKAGRQISFIYLGI